MIVSVRTQLQLLFLLVLTCFFVHPHTLNAQQSLSLSVTPPLFQMNVNPGETFQSAVKVVNNNPYPITVWAEAVEFTSSGENGHGRFIPVIEGEPDDSVMASWIQIVEGPYNIGAEQSFNVPFTLDVPESAPPGGHSAAILVGTRPPKGEGAAVVNTSQMVTSLFFARVAGDVIENGDIREFSVAKLFQPKPEASFTLRFENKGNVHLRPMGNITIYNMWGKERGYIPINQKTTYGNVLPESIRKYEFTWSGEQSITDIGRYKAILTVGYGQDGVVYLDRTAYFWVIPVKSTLITLLVVGLIVFSIVWMIRQYVRRAMMMAGFDPDAARKEKRSQKKESKKPIEVTVAPVSKRSVMSAPLRAGVVDLRARISKTKGYRDQLAAFVAFLKQYRIFSLSVAVLLFVLILVAWYIADVRTEGRNYEVTLPQDGGAVQISSEEIIKDRLEEEKDDSKEDGQHSIGSIVEDPIAPQVDQSFQFEIINASGQPGAAAEVAIDLEDLGYIIDSIATDADREQNRSVIVYDPILEDAAVTLSNQLGNVPLSVHVPEAAATSTDTALDEPVLLLIVGGDLIKED